jgi:predicted tellurium resistance membrane protein TerC
MLGIDNVVFTSVLAGRLPSHRQQRARVLGLSLALITRLLLGGLFLLGKATYEIHEQLEGTEHGITRNAASMSPA